MDVERLMKDLSVERLEIIQKELQGKMESKREELRDMVGRRYRDVLDASSEVHQVHSLAESLCGAVSAARCSAPSVDSLLPCNSRLAATNMQRLAALRSLLPLIANEESMDAVNDAYALLLAEHLQRILLTQQNNSMLMSLLPAFSHHLQLARADLMKTQLEDLAQLSRSDWAANQLAAVAMVQSHGVEQLLQDYLAARKNHIKKLLDSSSTLLTFVKECKCTLKVVEELFSHGEMLRILQAISAPNFRPEVVEVVLRDAPFASFSRVLAADCEAVNRQQRDKKHATLLTSFIHEKTAEWIQDICELSRSTVKMICDNYETIQSIIEFSVNLTDVLSEDWPRLGSSSSTTVFHQKLLGNIVDEKFKCLVRDEVSELESAFQCSLTSMSPSSLSPPPLFEKRPEKLDQLLAAGFPRAIKESVSVLYSGISSLLEASIKYEQASSSRNQPTTSESSNSPSPVRDTLATEIVELIHRLASASSYADATGSVESEILRARCCLALLHCDSATLCKALNREGSRVSACSTALHNAIQESLSNFVTNAITSAMKGSQILAEFVESASSHIGAIHFALILSALSDAVVSHLLSRSVRKTVTAEIGSALRTVYTSILENAPKGHADTLSLPQRSLIQLLFDCRVLAAFFPASNANGVDVWQSMQKRIEESLDPFDLTLLAPLLTANTRTALHRTQLTVAALLMDWLPAKESKEEKAHSHLLIDILPRMDNFIARIPAIPRLDRNNSSNQMDQANGGKGARHNSLLAHPNMASKPSLSSFYDKISSSWFGN